MYDISTYIYLISMVNVGKYIIFHGCYGYILLRNIWAVHILDT